MSHTVTEFKAEVDDHNTLLLEVNVGGLTIPLKLEFEFSSAGVRLLANGDSMAYLDLYYLDPDIAPEERERLVQLVIDDWAARAGGDPVAFARYTPRGTRVVFEVGVDEVEKQAGYDGAAWGYPEEKNDEHPD